MVSADRQQIIETNKSLRLIKNELESLLEKGVIDDAAYDSIHALLPAEGSLHGSAARAAPAPAATPDISRLAVSDTPPAYTTPSPAPSATATRPPPPPPPSKPVLCHARALYRYPGTDARDCAFERDDRVAVHEYMNADWWMGRNLRTGREGIFPRNYVEPEPAAAAPVQDSYANEKAAGYNAYQQPQSYYGGGGGAYQPPQQPPPQQQNPYSQPAPPMAVANPEPAPQQQDSNSNPSMGRKIAGKFGNAAIFGAGATAGSNLINSIF